jgi:DNA polymerase-3 subunit delta'
MTSLPNSVASEIRGHKEILQRLFSAVQKNQLPQTMIFVGPEGVGKQKVALAVSQALVCTSEQRPCGLCGPCVRMFKRQSESLMVIEPGLTGIKVEQSREVISFLHLQVPGNARCILINDAHRMNTQAANALLKTLEEPPEKNYFFLIAPSPNAVLPTIRSRSQVIRFRPLSKTEMMSIDTVPDWVINSAQGRMDRLTELTQSLDIRRSAVKLFFSAPFEGIYSVFNQIKEECKEREAARFFTQTWEQLLRDALVLKSGNSDLIHQDLKPDLIKLSELSTEKLLQMYDELLVLKKDIEANVDRALGFEEFFIKTRTGFQESKNGLD